MFKTLRFNFYKKGITLIEIVVVIFIITIFSMIAINDFPKIKKNFSLSNATHKLSQDLRKVQDMGLSGVKLEKDDGTPISAKGYGLYINLNQTEGNKKYIIYADLDNDQKYTPGTDYISETINIAQENPEVIIREIRNVTGNLVSINITPPNPSVLISVLGPGQNSVEIILGLESDTAQRTVTINRAGLINVAQ